jgi:hypothetical protein
MTPAHYAVIITLLILIAFWLWRTRSTLDTEQPLFTLNEFTERIRDGDKIRLLSPAYTANGKTMMYPMRAVIDAVYNIKMFDGSQLPFLGLRFPSSHDPSVYSAPLEFTVSGLTPLADNIPGSLKFTNTHEPSSCSRVNPRMRLTTEIDGKYYRLTVGYNPAYEDDGYERYELSSGSFEPVAIRYEHMRAQLYLVPEPIDSFFAPYVYFTPVNEFGKGALSGATVYADSKTGIVDHPVRIGSAIPLRGANEAISSDELAGCGSERVLQCTPNNLTPVTRGGKTVYGCSQPMETLKDSLVKGHIVSAAGSPYPIGGGVFSMTTYTYPNNPPNITIQKVL